MLNLEMTKNSTFAHKLKQKNINLTILQYTRPAAANMAHSQVKLTIRNSLLILVLVSITISIIEQFSKVYIDTNIALSLIHLNLIQYN